MNDVSDAATASGGMTSVGGSGSGLGSVDQPDGSVTAAPKVPAAAAASTSPAASTLDSLHELELVGGHDERRPVAVRLFEKLEQGRLAAGVEPDEGLVDEEDLERADEAHRQRRLLAQAPAERDRKVVGPFVEAEMAEEVGGVLLPVVASVRPCVVLQV